MACARRFGDRRIASAQLALLVVLAFAIAAPVSAQQPALGSLPINAISGRGVTAGSPTENSLLSLSLLTDVRPHVLVRPLQRSERDALMQELRTTLQERLISETNALVWVRPWSTVWLNSASANPDRDGAVWQGRGLTAAVGAGLTYENSIVRIALRPVVFAAQNSAFVPAHRDTAALAGDFRDPVFGGGIDAPFRFGDRVYVRADPGESTIRLEAFNLSTGFSTEAQQWGPSVLSPLIMGTESGGYPRLLLETGAIPVVVGELKAQWSVGRVESSGFAMLPDDQQRWRSRMVPSLAISFVPQGFRGLEVGAARLFHLRWSPDNARWSNTLLPFRGLLKARNPTGETATRTYNQLASVFARLAPPRGSIELYGEFYRDDHSVDLRDLELEPDHSSGYTIGVRQIATRSTTRRRAVVLEATNSRKGHLERVRGQDPLYMHGAVGEGHTNRGQLLGTSSVPSGGGIGLAVEDIDREKSQMILARVLRTAQNKEGGSWNGRAEGALQLRFIRTRWRKATLLRYAVGLHLGLGDRRPPAIHAELSRTY